VSGLSAAYNVLYDVDFRTLPNQPLVAPGSYVIDGKTWWMKGALGNAPAATEIVNGQGFHFAWPFNGTFPSPDYGGWRSFSFTPCPRTMLLPLAQLPGFNPKSPIAILTRMTSVNNLNEEFWVGVMDHAANASPISSVEHDTQMTMCRTGTTSTWWTSQKNADTRNPQGTNYGPKLDSYVLGVIRPLAGFWYPMMGQWNGTALGIPDDYDGVTDTGGNHVMPSRCSDSPSFVWAFSYTNSGQPAMNAYMTHLKIMQPK
jgi:hypothetical protein